MLARAVFSEGDAARPITASQPLGAHARLASITGQGWRGRDTQRTNSIAGCPRGTDLVALANHVAGRDMTCALAKSDEKFEG
jgi:hypothetical protein